MSASGPDAERLPIATGDALCALDDIAPGHSRGFRVEGRTSAVSIFLVRPKGARAGEVYGYINQCAHRSMPLEWVEDEFLDEGRDHLICANHGAIYRIADGFCIGGPCPGKSLQALSLEVSGGRVRVVKPPAYR